MGNVEASKKYPYAMGEVEHICAVTFVVRDMARSVAFYQKLGFSIFYGGEDASFSSFRFGEAFVNLRQQWEWCPSLS